jgi:hypothetical protein
MYKDRIQQLLEALNTKIEAVEKFHNGTLNLSRVDVSRLLAEIKQLSERIANLVENDR